MAVYRLNYSTDNCGLQSAARFLLTPVVDAVLAATVAVRVAAVAEVGAAGPLAAPVARGGLSVFQREAGTTAAVQPPRGPRQAASCP